MDLLHSVICALTGCNVEIAVLALVLRMLRVLAGQIIGDALVLNGLVLATKTNIPVRMQRRHMLSEFIYGHRRTYLISDLDGHLPVHLRRIRMMWRIVQVVVGRMEALSAEMS